jgi:hypothetical protein
VLATIDDPAVIARILTHLGLTLNPGVPAPGRAPREGLQSVGTNRVPSAAESCVAGLR